MLGLQSLIVVDPLSDQNPLIKKIRRAVAQGGLTADGYAVAEGPHLLQEARASRCEIAQVLATETAAYKLGPGRDFCLISEKTMVAISSTETPQGVIALVRPPDWALTDVFAKPALAVVLDGVQDPGNAGAIVRAAEAFEASGVVFLKGSVNPYHPRCLRASAGSLFRLPVVSAAHFEELIQREVHFYAAMAGASRPLNKTDFSGPCAIIIGSEGHGVSRQWQGRAIPVSIPTRGVESLNAAVATGVLLYEAQRQRGSKP